MRIVNVYEAKTQLSKLLAAVERGEDVVIARAGRPIADLKPHVPRHQPVTIGGLAGEIEYDEDDFDRIDPEIMRMFYGDDWEPDAAGG
jgi:prevent-host-death family protein